MFIYIMFLDAIKLYFNNILDITSFIIYFIVSSSLVVLVWPTVIKKKNIIQMVLTFVISYLVFVFFCGLMFGLARISNFILYNLSMPLVVAVFCLIFADGTWVHKLIKTLVLVSAMCVADVLAKNFGFLIGTLTETKMIIVAARSFPSLFFLAMCIIFKFTNIAHYRNLTKEMIVICCSLSVLLITASIAEHNYQNKEVVPCFLLSILDIVLLFILGFVYVSMYKIIENRHHITNLEVQKTLGEAERMSIIIDQNNREELEKIRHDLKNQLSYVNILLQEGKVDEAKGYIDHLFNNQEALHSFSCSNSVINSIVNLELTKAKIHNIKIDVKVVVPPRLPFEDNDLVSLLTNMIDNALENYDSNKDEPVIVRIIKQNDYIRFMVTNPVSEDTTEKDIKKSSKKGRGHGYGTKIIKNIVSKYNGYVDFDVEDGKFMCDAVLNLN